MHAWKSGERGNCAAIWWARVPNNGDLLRKRTPLFGKNRATQDKNINSKIYWMHNVARGLKMAEWLSSFGIITA
jgi:hypothetical protein